MRKQANLKKRTPAKKNSIFSDDPISSVEEKQVLADVIPYLNLSDEEKKACQDFREENKKYRLKSELFKDSIYLIPTEMDKARVPRFKTWFLPEEVLMMKNASDELKKKIYLCKKVLKCELMNIA